MKLEEVLKDTTYKPGYRLSVQHGEQFDRLVLHAFVWDSRKKERTHISMNWPVPAGDLPERDWLKFIRWAIISLEVHEVEEWLHYKGEVFFDPHT